MSSPTHWHGNSHQPEGYFPSGFNIHIKLCPVCAWPSKVDSLLGIEWRVEKWRVVSLKDRASERKNKQAGRLSYCQQCPLACTCTIESPVQASIAGECGIHRSLTIQGEWYSLGQVYSPISCYSQATWCHGFVFVVVKWPDSMASSVVWTKKFLLHLQSTFFPFPNLFSKFPINLKHIIVGRYLGTSGKRIQLRTKLRGWDWEKQWGEAKWISNGQVPPVK